jgi:hypothetical protein
MTTIPHPTAPLLRRRADGGWERLAFGSLLRGSPVYEPAEFDEAAWLEKQRKAAKMREGLSNV